MRGLLTQEAIRLQLPSVSRDEAISQAGRLLVQKGYVNSSYIAAMFEREDQVSTFIGRGVAIPHGSVQDPNLVHQSGIVLLQYPEGILYDGHICYIVIGIASHADQHLEILRHIALVLSNQDILATLWTTNDVAWVVSLFEEGLT